MKASETTAKLFTALSKFQGELDNASKGKQGHGYKYADLAQCINVAKPHLAENGLAVTQLMGMTDGKQTIITVLAHGSGEFISSETIMPNATLQGGAGKNPVQVLGSAITYMRRYCFAAIIGMAQEDDDGHSNHQQERAVKQKPALSMDSDLEGWIRSELQEGKLMDHVIEILKRDWSIDQNTMQQIKAIGA